ncbi:ArsA family ATPase [Halorientalis pallida]|uniref:ArsA family ATPase n=1 Tax=Halorientalis pallida TaxID=2479928 RepID=A0A498KZZ6_9EURY|nr:TRC40/GET3/ArsA family transport-energizing ATPase [Halorientalis pallida]RXK48374.1 ArsA family ATPase [Halorientalis pallida]
MDLEVEAVEEIDETAVPTGVDAADYVLYGGKGGVGKTTMAAATALASARDGTATLVVSTDPAHSLSDTLETTIPADPERIREDVPLYAAEIDPEEAVGDGPFDAEGGLGGMGGLGQLLGGGGPMGGMSGQGEQAGSAGPGAEDDATAADPLAGPMPGMDEAAAMRLLLEYMDDERFDRVIVDTAPTGHTLRLLELPELLDSMMGRLLKLRQRLSGLFDSLPFGGGDDDQGADMEDLEVLRERIERLRAVLRDPAKTDFRIVMVPEELSVMESQRLLDRLDSFGVPVETVVVNRVMQDLADVADVEGDWFVSPDLDDCEFCQRRWQVQQNALTEAQDLFRGHDVKRVPLFADEVRGENLLRVVAACLD